VRTQSQWRTCRRRRCRCLRLHPLFSKIPLLLPQKPRFLREPTARIQSILISSFRPWMPSGRSPGGHPPRQRRRGARSPSSRRAGSSRRAKLRRFLAPSHPRRWRRVARRAWLDARRLRAPRARQAPGRVCRRGAGGLGRRKVVVAPRGGRGRGAPWRRRAGVVLRFPDRAGLPEFSHKGPAPVVVGRSGARRHCRD